MSSPESSSRKVPYDLRPKKQVERRMMTHTFQLLAEAGFPISTYRYAGFGAFFFVDFVVFRNHLHITDMVSIEHDFDYENRVKFNKPYRDIAIAFQTASAYIDEMPRDLYHILWLDYDGPISKDFLVDVQTASSKLRPGSILISTFDVDFDKADDRIRSLLQNERAREWHIKFQNECGDLLDPTKTIFDFNASSISTRTIEVVQSATASGVNMRQGVSFEPLFSFLYSDGHEMLTTGGMICSKAEKGNLRRVDWAELPFIRRDFGLNPFRIEVPVLTRRERLFIDSHMPSDEGWKPAEFELDEVAVQNYRQVFRYCPLYGELML